MKMHTPGRFQNASGGADIEIGAFPYETEAELATSLLRFYDTTLYADVGRADSRWISYTGFVMGDRGAEIKAYWQSIASPISHPIEYSIADLDPYVTTWKRMSNEQCSDNRCLLSDYQEINKAHELLKILLDTVRNNVLIATAIAFITIFLSCRDILVSLIGATSIWATMASVIAAFLSLGNEIDAVAGVLLTMVAGLSIDFTAHVCHSYTAAHASDRKERCLDVVMSLGPAIRDGAGTTLVGSVFLFLCTSVFFTKMGLLLALVTAFSCFYVATLLLPLLALFGPTPTAARPVDRPSGSAGVVSHSIGAPVPSACVLLLPPPSRSGSGHTCVLNPVSFN